MPKIWFKRRLYVPGGPLGLEGRSTFRAWLYRIATNACLDAIKAKKRRIQVVDVGPTADPVPFVRRGALASTVSRLIRARDG